MELRYLTLSEIRSKLMLEGIEISERSLARYRDQFPHFQAWTRGTGKKKRISEEAVQAFKLVCECYQNSMDRQEIEERLNSEFFIPTDDKTADNQGKFDTATPAEPLRVSVRYAWTSSTSSPPDQWDSSTATDAMRIVLPFRLPFSSFVSNLFYLLEVCHLSLPVSSSVIPLATSRANLSISSSSFVNSNKPSIKP